MDQEDLVSPYFVLGAISTSPHEVTSFQIIEVGRRDCRSHRGEWKMRCQVPVKYEIYTRLERSAHYLVNHGN